MSRRTSNNQGDPPPTILAEFRPFEYLWTAPKPLFPSRESAVWTKRRLAKELADADALAILRGRLYAHPMRFAAVVERAAIAAAKARVAA